MRPLIGMIMDENASAGGTRYDPVKGHFNLVGQAGGMGVGLPYEDSSVEFVREHADGLYGMGGFAQFPAEWFAEGHKAVHKPSQRFQVEIPALEIMQTKRKPILGICHFMHVMAALNGCLLRSDVAERHNLKDHGVKTHEIDIVPGTKLHQTVGCERMRVTSRHSEAVATLGPNVVASAYGPDGTIEAIELTDHPFAIGVQWHPEDYANSDHPSNRIFQAFISHCRV